MWGIVPRIEDNMGKIDKKGFGERLKKAREEKGLSQKELAGLLEISSVMISQYERGTRFPKNPRVQKLANELDIKPSYLLGFKQSLENETLNFLADYP